MTFALSGKRERCRTSRGDFRFDGMTAALQPNGVTVPNTGNTFAGFLLGHVRQASFTRELTS